MNLSGERLQIVESLCGRGNRASTGQEVVLGNANQVRCCMQTIVCHNKQMKFDLHITKQLSFVYVERPNYRNSQDPQ